MKYLPLCCNTVAIYTCSGCSPIREPHVLLVSQQCSVQVCSQLKRKSARENHAVLLLITDLLFHSILGYLLGLKQCVVVKIIHSIPCYINKVNSLIGSMDISVPFLTKLHWQMGSFAVPYCHCCCIWI